MGTEEYTKEIRQLASAWNEWIDSTGSPREELHLAPSFDSFITETLNMGRAFAEEQAKKCDDSVEDIYESVLYRTYAIMFQFGQHTAKLDTPILYSDLQPCACSAATDELIDKLLGR